MLSGDGNYSTNQRAATAQGNWRETFQCWQQRICYSQHAPTSAQNYSKHRPRRADGYDTLDSFTSGEAELCRYSWLRSL